MRCKRMGRNWIAIKLDLEKVYDRVSWDYIHDTFIAVGISIFFKKSYHVSHNILFYANSLEWSAYSEVQTG